MLLGLEQSEGCKLRHLMLHRDFRLGADKRVWIVLLGLVTAAEEGMESGG